MEGQYTTGQNGRSAASWWIMAIAALLVGGLIGYYLGTAGVGTGLVPEENSGNPAASVETEGSATSDAPANPFEDDGYQNPFE